MVTAGDILIFVLYVFGIVFCGVVGVGVEERLGASVFSVVCRWFVCVWCCSRGVYVGLSCCVGWALVSFGGRVDGVRGGG